MLRFARYDQQNGQIISTRVLMHQHRQPSPNGHVYAPHAYEHEPCPSVGATLHRSDPDKTASAHSSFTKRNKHTTIISSE
jgi:hypothetical protein